MPDISIAFRFHGNLYHSYRGDSLDERGIGKDIRIIRSILDDLDGLRAGGVPVCGTWDFDNHFSLGEMIPRYAPDILERIRSRVRAGWDEIEAMSWNNGITSAQTEEEFRRTLAWTISNPEGSGLADLFDEWAPVVRPQECMFTASQIRHYRAVGIRYLSLYYSAIPFNGFSNFVPPLSIPERHNPLVFTDPETGESMTIVPAYNHGDIVDNLGLRRWVKRLRRAQLRSDSPVDLFLLVDMDADDDFWTGYGRVLGRFIPMAGGLHRLAMSIADLPYIHFVRPMEYLDAHEPLGHISFGQDTADGSYDGYASWAEKRSNIRLWTGIQRSRLLDKWTREILRGDSATGETAGFLEKALRERLRAQSTTHFGLSSPVMNVHRLAQAEAVVAGAVSASRKALEAATAVHRGRIDTDSAEDEAAGRYGGGIEIADFDAVVDSPLGRGSPEDHHLAVGDLRFGISSAGRPWLIHRGNQFIRSSDSGPGIRYAGREIRFRKSGFFHHDAGPGRAERLFLRLVGRIPGSRKSVIWRGAFSMVGDPPGVLCEILIDYPVTPDRDGHPRRARLLGRSWDRRWRDTRPFEISPEMRSTTADPMTIWKKNFFGDLSFYRLPAFPAASMNNQVTAGWLAAAAGGRGLAIATTCLAETSFAFCPLKSTGGKDPRVRLNPMGTYSGPQWRYPTAYSGLGRVAASVMADHLTSAAPSYAGSSQRVVLLLAPYDGNRPPESLEEKLDDFAMPSYPGRVPFD